MSEILLAFFSTSFFARLRLFFYDDDDDDDDDDDSCVCNTPSSYRQPFGKGQLLSRRYCKHSGCLLKCAFCTTRESHGALAVSRKYFKQSNWPYLAA